MSASPPADPWVGRLLGDRQRYLLKQRIGRGGMGDVYLATDTLLGQPVALKLLSNRLATDELKKRFEREVAVCVALRNAHIVQVSDFGVTQEGYPFFVMEYLRGQTLGQLLYREKKLSIERTGSILTQICSGLYPAHQGVLLQCNEHTSTRYAKVVHRDLKPDNIFLVSTELGDFVKILDFGIAKIHSEQANSTHATKMFLGTFQYSSPEQLNNEKTLDERADIYSLGIILYEMLSSTKPFCFKREQGENLEPAGMEWVVAHLTQPPIPLRQQPGCEHLPAKLEALVMQCLEKSPDRRFSSVVELSEAVYAAVPSINRSLLATLAPAAEGIERFPAPSAPTLHSPQSSEARRDGRRFSNLSTLRYQPLLLPSPPRGQHKKAVVIGSGVVSAIAMFLVAYSLQSPAFLSFRQATSSQEQAPSEPVNDKNSEPQSSPVFAAKTLLGHQDTVWAVAVSPDGQTIVSGAYDKTIRFWDRQTGEVRRVLSAHTDAVRAIAISPDGKILASGGGDNVIKLWNFRTGELLHNLEGHSGPIWSVAISPDSKTLASASYDGTIRIWAIETGELLKTLPDHYDSVWSVAISPDGNILASASYDGTIKLWDFQTGAKIRTLAGHADVVRSVTISPDGKTLASASWDKTVKVWDLTTGALRHTLSEHTERVLAVAISPTGQTLASSSTDRTIHVWDLQSGKRLRTFSGHSDWVLSLAYIPDLDSDNRPVGKTLVSGSKDRKINLWQW